MFNLWDAFLQSDWMPYTLAAFYSLTLLVAWAANFITLPGNWMIVGIAGWTAWLGPDSTVARSSWMMVAILAGLAALGEVLELFASAGNAARLGGSRRGTLLSIVGAMTGSLLGAIVGLPIPIPLIAPAIAAVLGGAIGAFLGALAGEHWKGRPLQDGVTIGRAAFFGRFLGTAGKLLVGAIMVVVCAFDLWT